MPHLDLPGGVHMRYERMSSSDPDPGAHDKPLLVVVVPFTSAPISTLPQLHHSSLLRHRYDIVALAPRSHGETIAPITAGSDHYVAAAELALAYEALRLPPCPLYAPSMICGRIALAFTILFPNLVTSLALAGLGTRRPRRSMAQLVGFCELAVSGDDAEIVVEMFTELATTLGGQGQTEEQRDVLVKFLLRQGGPRRTKHSYERMVMWYREANLPGSALGEIRQPILLLYGANDDDSLPDNDDWPVLLCGSKRVQTELIPDTNKLCWLQAPAAVNQHILDFFSEAEPPTSSEPASPDLETALSTLASVCHEPSVRDRDPSDPQSFSALTTEELEARREALVRVQASEDTWCAKHEAPDPWDVPSPSSSVDESERWSPRDTNERDLASTTSPPLVSPPLVSETVTIEVNVVPESIRPGVKPDQLRKQSVVSVESDKSGDP